MDKRITPELLERFARGLCTYEEELIIEAWLAKTDDPFDEKSFSAYPADPETQQAIWDELSEKRIPAQPKGREIRGWIFRIAAACLIGVVALGGYYFYGNKNAPVKQLEATVIPEIQFTAPAGKITALTLPDNSKLTLTPGSKVHYPSLYTKKRQVTLVSGEVFFNVKHDAALPFSVYASGTEIQVLGTHFNVKNRANEGRIEVTLTQGSIRFTAENDTPTLLAPGQQLHFDKQKSQITSIKMVDTRYVTSWTEGKLWFKETPFGEVLAQTALYYDVRFQPGRGVDLRAPLNGKFDNKPLAYVLRLLENSTGYSFRQKGKIIYVNNPENALNDREIEVQTP